MQRCLVVSYQHLGTTYQSHLQGPAVQEEWRSHYINIAEAWHHA